MTKKIEIVEYTSGEIKRAGKALMINKKDKSSLDTLAYFRGDHAKPLENAYSLIHQFLENEKDVLIAKRLKRTPSIINKLVRLQDKNTQLSTMQDIGGCRVVLNTIRSVNKFFKNLIKEGTFKLKHNYIEVPKKSGYRSVHLIGKFDNGYGRKRTIELQVRTYIQHSWATAVEIVDLFTKESIKSNTGSKDWTEFFSLVSKQFEVLEKNPYLHSKNEKLLIEHFKKEVNNSNCKILNTAVFGVFALSKKLDIDAKFCSYRDSVKVMAEALNKNIHGFFLISMEFGLTDTIIKISHFQDSELNKANEEYLKLEEFSLANENHICALVSTMSIGGIEKAYPNYFADSTKFIEYLELFNSNFEQNQEVQKNIKALLLEELYAKDPLLSTNISKTLVLNNDILDHFSSLPKNERNVYDRTHLDKLSK